MLRSAECGLQDLHKGWNNTLLVRVKDYFALQYKNLYYIVVAMGNTKGKKNKCYTYVKVQLLSK